MVRRSRTILSSAAISVMLLVALRLASAATTLKEEDRNHDGKTDQWTWRLGDRATTSLLDGNCDGRPDIMYVTGPPDYGYSVTTWMDDDYDGNYDELRVSHPATRGIEVWRRIAGQPTRFEYFKYDMKAGLRTRGKTSALGSKVLDGVTTWLCPEIERPKKGYWINHRDGVSVVHVTDEDGTQPERLLRIEVHLWTDDGDAELEYRDPGTTSPERLVLRQWDSRTTNPPHLKTVMTMWDADHDQRFEGVTFWRSVSNTSETLTAVDANRDGAYDEFYVKADLLVLRTEKDSDFDGRLDWVEIRAADGTKTRLIGDQIPDRTLRVVPIADEKIKSLLDRARAALVAGPPK